MAAVAADVETGSTTRAALLVAGVDAGAGDTSSRTAAMEAATAGADQAAGMVATSSTPLLRSNRGSPRRPGTPGLESGFRRRRRRALSTRAVATIRGTATRGTGRIIAMIITRPGSSNMEATRADITEAITEATREVIREVIRGSSTGRTKARIGGTTTGTAATTGTGTTAIRGGISTI